MSYFYYIEPLYGEIEVELEYDVYYDYCPGDRDTPPACDCYVEYILHKGKEVSEEALVRLFSIHHGCHMPPEAIHQILIEAWEDEIAREAEDVDAEMEYQADFYYQQRREERI